MLSGKRAFHGDSNVETMSAILKEEPAEIQEVVPNLTPGLDRIVRHCLEKNPAQRFQSASDIAFDLETISSQSGVSNSKLVAVKESKRRQFIVLGTALVVAIAALVGGFLIGKEAIPQSHPRFHQLTFQRGTIFAARFAPDGQSILYTAAWNGAPTGDMFTTRTDSIMSRPLDLKDAEVLSISAKGGMAIRLRSTGGAGSYRGMLAIVPITGGAPRELVDDVLHASWSPDGENLAIAHMVNQEWQLEYPIGKALFSSKAGLKLFPKFSPDGKWIAYFDHPASGDTRGYVAVTDLQGKSRRLSREWSDLTGLDWSPSGKEVWFTGTDSGINSKLYAVDLSGNLRDLLHVPGRLKISDISEDGKVLITNETNRQEVYGKGPFKPKELNLSWFDWTLGRAISSDGQWAVLEEDGEGGGPEYSVFLRKLDGSEAIRLGTGWGGAISDDNKWVVSGSVKQPAPTVLLPTGAGQPRPLGDAALEKAPGAAAWIPGGRGVLVLATEPGQSLRTYLVPLDGGLPKAVGPPGFRASIVSTDGKQMAGRVGPKRVIVDIDSAAVVKELDLQPTERLMEWSTEPGAIYTGILNQQVLEVSRLDLNTGKRAPIFNLAPSDLSGVSGVGGARLTRDGKYYVFTTARTLSDLYVVEGLK